MSIFPRPVEIAVRVLKEICAAPQNPVPLRARAAELILSAYGLVSLPPERESTYRGLKRIKTAVDVSALDNPLAAKIREQKAEECRLKKIGREIRKLAGSPAPKEDL